MKQVKRYHVVSYISLVTFIIILTIMGWFNVPVFSSDLIVRGMKDLFTGGFIGAGTTKLLFGLIFILGTFAFLAFLILLIVRAVKKNRKEYLGMGIAFLVDAYIILGFLFFVYYGTLGVEIAGHVNIINYYIKSGLKWLFDSTASMANHAIGFGVVALAVTILIFVVLEVVAYFKTLKLVENGEEASSDSNIMTEDEMRQIIREELLNFYGKAEHEEVKEEVVQEEIPVVEEVVIPVETVVEEVVENKEEPLVEEERIEEVSQEETIVPADLNSNGRISFFERILIVDKELLDTYNELKNEIMSYGVKSRVSSTGDTFRLHRITYMKMIFSGKKVKLYMKLNPKKYTDSTIPHGDVSHKKIYEEIPFVFKVKSGLSLRRAKALIKTMMDESGLVQQHEPETIDYASKLIKEIKSGKRF